MGQTTAAQKQAKKPVSFSLILTFAVIGLIGAVAFVLLGREPIYFRCL